MYRGWEEFVRFRRPQARVLSSAAKNENRRVCPSPYGSDNGSSIHPPTTPSLSLHRWVLSRTSDHLGKPARWSSDICPHSSSQDDKRKPLHFATHPQPSTHHYAPLLSIQLIPTCRLRFSAIQHPGTSRLPDSMPNHEIALDTANSPVEQRMAIYTAFDNNPPRT